MWIRQIVISIPLKGIGAIGIGQSGKAMEQSSGDLAERRIVEFFRGILCRVVVGIAIKGGVSDHEGAIALAPEGKLITPGHSGYNAQGGNMLQGKVRMGSERPGRPEHQSA